MFDLCVWIWCVIRWSSLSTNYQDPVIKMDFQFPTFYLFILCLRHITDKGVKNLNYVTKQFKQHHD